MTHRHTSSTCSTRLRLLQAFSELRALEILGKYSGNPAAVKAAKDRIVWRELLDLELQDVDDRMNGISKSPGGDHG